MQESVHKMWTKKRKKKRLKRRQSERRLEEKGTTEVWTMSWNVRICVLSIVLPITSAVLIRHAAVQTD
jgi:hypothetical protein